MSDITYSAGDAPSGESLVRQWQSQLQGAFDVSGEAAPGETYDRLREALATGLFGGLPLSGDAVDAMVVLLERLDWTYSPARMARAVPHFPTRFDLETLRETMARLRYSSREALCRAAELTEKDCPAIVVGDHDALRVVDFVDGRARLFDADGRLTDEALPAGKRTIIHFRRKQDDIEEEPVQGWLGSRVRRLTGPIGLLFGLTGFINLMVLVTSFTVMAIYDSVIPAKRFDTLLAIMIGLGVAVSIELAFRRLKARLIGRLCGRLEYMVGTSIFSKLLSLPAEMISSVPIGTQISRLSQFETVRDLFAGPFAAIVLEIPFVAIFVVLLFAIGGPLGFIAVALIAVYILLGILFLPALRHRVAEASRLRQERQALMLETATNIRTIRAAGCEEIWGERLCDAIRLASDANRRSQALNRLLVTLSGAGVPVAGAATAILGAMLVMEGELSVGVLVGSMIVIWRVLAPIQQAFLTLTRIADMAATMRQIDQMMRIPARETVSEAPVRRHFQGRITLDRVSFRYPGTSQAAIAGISLDIKAGEFIAVMGASGAGKTTLLRLMLDLYRPNAGI
ncbi:MAG: ATP-binding cassette domain-containing protein, partial [Rhodobiaceae bacterium]|nr:ATP-binding cassette domain-containing protein [Rhodobiaceae bacterium]